MEAKSVSIVHVKVENRHFVVRFDLRGSPTSIKERKIHAPGRPWESRYDAQYWHHSMKMGGASTMVRRILKAASVKAHIPNSETVAAMEESREMQSQRRSRLA